MLGMPHTAGQPRTIRSADCRLSRRCPPWLPPAIATLPAVATEPATATLPAVATEPATATAPVVAADPATAMLSMLAIERLITMCGFR